MDLKDQNLAYFGQNCKLTLMRILAIDDRCYETILHLSCYFFCEVPDNISDSFYSGDVYVGYKNTIFESSNAICHATKFFQTISLKFSNEIPPILCLYTDGGPDHRTNFESVQISLISLFFKGDFDIIIAIKTAPYHSWANPAKRIMSIFNLGLQIISLVYNEFSLEQEKIFKQLNTIEAIQKAKENNNLLKKELKDSIMNIKNLLNKRTTD
ncbi:hypothetical protein F8M41_020483 [Gigaspora margarita]|uniref:Uncharacterized protein n=1 Tax=Gigaspora margarita TaxID=4874 RepID=A0A8H4EJP2_GIGMA|nr:hypothetical protein F8M41_020483 [Gigaspora margarita]